MFLHYICTQNCEFVMKKRRYTPRIRTFVLFILLTQVYACTKDTSNINTYSFDTIDLDYRPKEALDSLETYLSYVDEMPKDERYAFELRYNLSRGRNFLPLPTDSTIKKNIKYFKHKQDTQRLLNSYLLLAYAYFDSKDFDKLHETIQAAVETPDADKYPKQLAHLYSMQGDVFFRSHFDSLASIAFKHAHKLYLSTNDTTMLTCSYKDLGAIALKLNTTSDSALLYLNKSLETAIHNKDTLRINGIIPSIASIYIQDGNIESAKKILNKITLHENSQIIGKYTVLVKYYRKIDDFNMERIYCDSLITLGSPRALKQGHYFLFKAYEKRNDIKNAYHHLYYYTYWKDSIKREERTVKLYEVESKYQNKLLRSQNRVLKAENTAAIYGIGALVFIGIIVGGLIYIWYHRHVQTQIEESKRKELRQKKLYNHSLQQISQMKQEMDELQNKMKEETSLSASGLQTIQSQQALLASRIKKAENDRLNRRELEKQLYNTPIYLKLLAISKGENQERFTSDDWQGLYKNFEQTYDNLLYTLKEAGHNINEAELQLCCLAKLGISHKGITIVTNRASSTISTMKPRIYKKITDQEGNANDFHKFIESL